MFSPGIRNPRRSVLICVAVAVVAWSFIAWGAFEMHLAGEDTPSSGMKIGLALLPGILAPLMAVNFWFAIKVIAAIRRGEKQVGRWTVTAAELEEFTAVEKVRNAAGSEQLNDWFPPREAPPQGFEIIFAADAVLAGDTYFSLANKGFYRFTGVRMISGSQPVIEFQTITTTANRFGTRSTKGELRLPVTRAASAEAAKVVAHFQQVRTGALNANPDFYRRRIRFGLIAAAVCFAVAAVGFVLGPNDVSHGSVSIPSVMVVMGLVFGIAALILAGAAKLLDEAQHRKRSER